MLSCSEAPGILIPQEGIQPCLPALQGRFLTIGTPRKSPVAISNEIVFLNLFSFWIAYCWHIYITPVFVHWAVYPVTLLNLSILSFSVESLGISAYAIMSPAKSDNFASSFPMRMQFISFSCITALAWISSAVLNRSGERWSPCLALHLRGNGFLSLLSMMVAVRFWYMFFFSLWPLNSKCR